MGPTEISGIARSLTVGLRSIGIDARTHLSSPHPYQYEDRASSKTPVLLRVWRWLGGLRRRSAGRPLLFKAVSVLAHNAWGFLVLGWAMAKFDVFVFLFGQTITNTRIELALLRSLGRKAVFLYVGSDTRPPYIDGTQCPVAAGADLKRAATLAARLKRRLSIQERYAHACINSPASAQFHDRPYINWFSIGIPRAIEFQETPDVADDGVLRILHSPSNAAAKGTAEILAAVSRLEAKGYRIQLIKIEGMPNAVVLSELARCDFVVDQLYSDTPMAVFATEAAHFGKPAVVGGYFARDLHRYIPDDDIPPSLYVSPDDIEGAIERLVVDREYRLDLGRRARDFVRSRWSCEEVARRLVRLIENEAPLSWWCNPHATAYVSGACMPESHARSMVRDLVARFGPRVLQVSGNPELESTFLQFAGVDGKALR